MQRGPRPEALLLPNEAVASVVSRKVRWRADQHVRIDAAHPKRRGTWIAAASSVTEESLHTSYIK
jgi:hypothetical protein